MTDLPPSIHVVVVVYGRAYTSLFAEIGLANLAALVREIPESLRAKSVVRIATTSEDIEIIQNAPALSVLRKNIRVEVDDRMQIAGFGQHGDYGPMVLTQCELVKEAARVGAALFFVGPDQIYNKGAFANHIARLRDGARVVIGPGVRIKRDAARPVLEAAIAASPDGAFALDAKTQTKLFFDHWHPINDQFLLNAAKGIPWKAYVYDRPEPGELLIRFFQGPTLAAWPRGPMEWFDGFVDHNVILGCCRSWREVHVVPDAEACLALDLTDDQRLDIQPLSDFPRVELLGELFDEQAIKGMQLHHGRFTCRIHLGDGVEKEVHANERRFAAAVDPLILMALSARRLRRYFGRLASVFRFICLAGTHTWTFLLRPVTWLLFRNRPRLKTLRG